MNGTVVLKCNCESKDQDELYGKGMRLHNVGGIKQRENTAYCTVCSPSMRRLRVSGTQFPVPFHLRKPKTFKN